MRTMLVMVGVVASAGSAVGQAVTMDPRLALPAERIFERMDTELVFCLFADSTPYGGWRVRTIELADQGTNAGRDGTSFHCEGAQGFMHNHPRLGDAWCKFSHTDRKTLEHYDFAILWCPSRRFVYSVRAHPVTLGAHMDTVPR